MSEANTGVTAQLAEWKAPSGPQSSVEGTGKGGKPNGGRKNTGGRTNRT